MKNYMSIISLYFEIVFIIFKQYIRVSFIIAHPSELENFGFRSKNFCLSVCIYTTKNPIRALLGRVVRCAFFY